jgi:hypothetical protein
MINIASDKVTGNCTLKCKCYITSNGLIQWKEIEYVVKETKVINPAIHLYGGRPVDAEINIVCKNDDSNKQLIIIIPLISNASGINVTTGQDVDIPLKPFYYYDNNIVFGKENAILVSNIKPTTLTVNKSLPNKQINLFYNPSGVGSFSNPSPDDIYIDCSPVKQIEPMATVQNNDDGNQKSTVWIWVLVPFLVIIILVAIAYYFKSTNTI